MNLFQEWNGQQRGTISLASPFPVEHYPCSAPPHSDGGLSICLSFPNTQL